MLTLRKIKKSYKMGETSIHALKGINLSFRKNELVSILGPSGCGKTTLLNVIGGLDHYDAGDLIINELSTKAFKDADWDAYRNRSIGFVFQNYNLISHQTVLNNVEISLTLSGVSKSERTKRAIEALEAVGLGDQLSKKPSQLSGGQMQRVAIARALVNNPDIILADEPTGALDSQTSAQVMDILKHISKDKLVIMVTHNGELAEHYSSRIIKILDGEVQSDTHPVNEIEIRSGAHVERTKNKTISKTAMRMTTAISLSFKNLLTKKWRTLSTSFAGSIGIIGVALVLALSTGLSAYMDQMQMETLSGFPITVSQQTRSIANGPIDNNMMTSSQTGAYTDENILINYDRVSNTTQHTNRIDEAYLDYVASLQDEMPSAVNTIAYKRGIDINILAKGDETVVLYSGNYGSMDGVSNMPFSTSASGSQFWQEMPDNQTFILSLYDLIGEGSRMPEHMNEVLLVVDENNRIDRSFFEKLGITSGDNYTLTDFIGKDLLGAVLNDQYYVENDGLFTAVTVVDYDRLWADEETVKLTITGILRIKEDASSSYFSTGIVYTTAFTDFIVDNAARSMIAKTQMEADYSVLTGLPFSNDEAKQQQLISLGAITTPIGVDIYPQNFEGKESIKEFLDAYNEGKEVEAQVLYTDMAETISNMTGTLLDTISIVLIGFAAISLVVSTIMIAIITYVSVIERTKEIGILRAVGARKKDVTRVFNAETLIIGFTAGAFGVLSTYGLSVPINAVISSAVGINGVAALKFSHAIILLVGSMGLTLIAGYIPSKLAAKKDPVEALRVE